MNPNTNRFEELQGTDPTTHDLEQAVKKILTPQTLARPDGSPVPDHWAVFAVGENVVIKNYTFRVAYVGESTILFEPVGPIVINNDNCGV